MLPEPSFSSQETPRQSCPPTNPPQAQLRLVFLMGTPPQGKLFPADPNAPGPLHPIPLGSLSGTGWDPGRAGLCSALISVASAGGGD